MFGKSTVAKRLALGFGVVILLMIIVAVLGVSRLAQLDQGTQLIVTDRWAKAGQSNDIVRQSSQIAIALRNMMLTSSREDMARQKERIMESRKAIAAHVDKLKQTVTLPRGKEILGQVLDQRDKYIAGQEKLIKLIETGSAEEAKQYLNSELRPVLAAYQGALDTFNKFQAELVDSAGKSASDTYQQARTLMLGMVALALLIAAVLAVWIIRSVTRPLGGEPEEAKAVVEKIAEGDLTAEIKLKAGDSGSLMAATRNMQLSLRKMVGELKQNAEGVAAAAQQLASSSSQVATATAHQSEAASSMAAAVEEMTVSINHVSDSARDAHSVTTATGGLSQAGNRVIQETVAEMRHISQTVGEAAGTIAAMGESSQKISGIVQVIKDVADQTNLLALNAAIEAARAGEQGRGFAVVADEVRKLAERTAQATTEISGMIEAVQGSAQAAVGTMQQAVTRVEQGLGMAQKASESMLGISDGAQKVVSAVNEISNALKEQSVASNDIASNVEKIAQMSEENSAATREAADTAHQLEILAAGTRAAVGGFRV
jgi:methyl-accepting chemotaxis protein